MAHSDSISRADFNKLPRPDRSAQQALIEVHPIETYRLISQNVPESELLQLAVPLLKLILSHSNEFCELRKNVTSSFYLYGLPDGHLAKLLSNVESTLQCFQAGHDLSYMTTLGHYALDALLTSAPRLNDGGNLEPAPLGAAQAPICFAYLEPGDKPAIEAVDDSVKQFRKGRT